MLLVDDIDQEAGMTANRIHHLTQERLDGRVELDTGESLEFVGDGEGDFVEFSTPSKAALRRDPAQELPNQEGEAAKKLEFALPPASTETDDHQGDDAIVGVVDQRDDRLPVRPPESLTVGGVEELVEWEKRMVITVGEASASGAGPSRDHRFVGDAMGGDDSVGLRRHVVFVDPSRGRAGSRTDLEERGLEARIRISWPRIDQRGADGPQHMLRRTDPAHFGHRRPIGETGLAVSEPWRRLLGPAC